LIKQELVLLNLFSSKAMVVSSCGYPWKDPWYSKPINHFVFSDDPDSSDGCILATITDYSYKIALYKYKVGCRTEWTTHGWEGKTFNGIAFCSGDLYGLAYPGEELVKFKIDMEKDGSLVVKSVHLLAIQRRHGPVENEDPLVYECYILELHGKPSKAVRVRWLRNREPFLKVFELVDANVGEAYQHKWIEVTWFGDYALFLGPTRSKAVHVPVGVEHCGFKRNHIYYSIAIHSITSDLHGDEVYSLKLDNGGLMSCREDKSIGDGLGRTGYWMTGLDNNSMWLDLPYL
jgi:hypothetical protein